MQCIRLAVKNQRQTDWTVKQKCICIRELGWLNMLISIIIHFHGFSRKYCSTTELLQSVYTQ